jgi:hypothetical protein
VRGEAQDRVGQGQVSVTHGVRSRTMHVGRCINDARSRCTDSSGSPRIINAPAKRHDPCPAPLATLI